MSPPACAAVWLVSQEIYRSSRLVAAQPAWKLNGLSLTEPETTLSHAVQSSLTIPGLTTTCTPFVYAMTISNSAGTGKGSVTEVPLSNCSTNSGACSVEEIEAEKLPWPAKLTKVSTSNYLVIESIKIGILYTGPECVLDGVPVTITGSAGGLFDNTTESVTYSSATFAATGTALKALGTAVEWTGTFTMLATGAHIGESLTVS